MFVGRVQPDSMHLVNEEEAPISPQGAEESMPLEQEGPSGLGEFLMGREPKKGSPTLEESWGVDAKLNAGLELDADGAESEDTNRLPGYTIFCVRKLQCQLPHRSILSLLHI